MHITVANYQSLKLNLRLSIISLEALIKKRTEILIHAKNDLLEYFKLGHFDHGRLCVLNIIKDESFLDGLNMVLLYCRSLISRFNTIMQMRHLDESVAEAVTCVMWVAQKLRIDVPELAEVAHLFVLKYGVNFAESVLTESVRSINKTLIRKIQMEPPNENYIEEYLKEIAMLHGICYVPSYKVYKMTQDLGAMKEFLNEMELNVSIHGASNLSSFLLSSDNSSDIDQFNEEENNESDDIDTDVHKICTGE